MKRAYIVMNDVNRKPHAIDYCANNWILIVGLSDRISGYEVKILNSNPDVLLIDEDLVGDLSSDFRRKLVRKNENASINVISRCEADDGLEIVPLRAVPDGECIMEPTDKRVSTIISVNNDEQGHLFTAYLAALIKSNFIKSTVSLSEFGCAFRELSFFPSASIDICNDLSDLFKVRNELNLEKLQKVCSRFNNLDLYICPCEDNLDQMFYESIIDALKDGYDFSFFYVVIRNGLQCLPWFISRSDLIFIVSDCSPRSLYFLRQNMEKLKSLFTPALVQFVFTNCDHVAAASKRVFRNLAGDFKTVFLPCDDGILLLYEQVGKILLNRMDLSYVSQVAYLASQVVPELRKL
ncbi:MAG: hypothetical protein M1371_07930 [Actinobacteria bacterium]|nr:hypothetical protein [Actinomycetota bacterium]